jgi:hypothetical protein
VCEQNEAKVAVLKTSCADINQCSENFDFGILRVSISTQWFFCCFPSYGREADNSNSGQLNLVDESIVKVLQYRAFFDDAAILQTISNDDENSTPAKHLQTNRTMMFQRSFPLARLRP